MKESLLLLISKVLGFHDFKLHLHAAARGPRIWNHRTWMELGSLDMNRGWRISLLRRPCTHRRACEGRQVVIHIFNANDAGGSRLQAEMLAIHVLHFYFQLVFIKYLERKNSIAEWKQHYKWSLILHFTTFPALKI